MPPSDVREGMRGVAKTVVQGDTIEEFDVDVLGVLQQRGPSGDLILVKVSGPVIEKTGGIAQGMSGSPVYIDGKLVGAIGYGWGFADGTVGMVTPIGDMLKLWALPDKAAHDEAPSAADPDGHAVDGGGIYARVVAISDAKIGAVRLAAASDSRRG